MGIEIKPDSEMTIMYEWWAGTCNMGFWTGLIDGRVYDYHSKKKLIEDAKKLGIKYKVLSHGKGKNRGKVKIIQQG